MSADPSPAPRPGHRVRFRVGDVFLPSAAAVLGSLGEDTQLVGAVIDLSDSGDRTGTFAVVRIGDDVNVVLPVTALSVVDERMETA